VHSSIDKAARVAGIGDANLVRNSGSRRQYFAMDSAALEKAIEQDRSNGFLPQRSWHASAAPAWESATTLLP